MCLGVPGKVVEIYEENTLRMARVDFGGVYQRACLEYMPDTAVGDYVIIHVGFAISKVDEREARQVFEFLEAMGELGEAGISVTPS